MFQVCAKTIKFAIPFIYLYPFIFGFSLIPAVGTCRQLLGPYQFGAIFIWYTGNWFDVREFYLKFLQSTFSDKINEWFNFQFDPLASPMHYFKFSPLF